MIKAIAIPALVGLLGAALISGCGSSSSAQGGEMLNLLAQFDAAEGERLEGTTLTLFDGIAYFAASTPDTGSEPWISDGTPEGTRRIMDIMPGPGGSMGPFFPPMFVELNGFVYFPADDGVHGRELWRTDGTAAGTELFADLEPGPGEFDLIVLRVSNNRLYVSPFDGVGLQELWMLEVTP